MLPVKEQSSNMKEKVGENPKYYFLLLSFEYPRKRLRDRRLHLFVVLNSHLIRHMNISWTERWHYPFPTACPPKHKVRVVVILICSLECLSVARKKAAFSKEWAKMCLSGLWRGGGRHGFDSQCREGNCTCISMWSNNILVLFLTKITVRVLVKSKSQTNLHNTSLITFSAQGISWHEWMNMIRDALVTLSASFF